VLLSECGGILVSELQRDHDQNLNSGTLTIAVRRESAPSIEKKIGHSWHFFCGYVSHGRSSVSFM
jgi:hypothetical protein